MTLPQLHQRRVELVAYLKSCISMEPMDLHGARDACTDIEVLDGRIAERVAGFNEERPALALCCHGIIGGAEHCGQCQATLRIYD